jgi:hypothetical protein
MNGTGGNGSWGVHLNGGAGILKLIVAQQPRRWPPMRMQLQLVFSVVSSWLFRACVVLPNCRAVYQMSDKG